MQLESNLSMAIFMKQKNYKHQANHTAREVTALKILYLSLYWSKNSYFKWLPTLYVLSGKQADTPRMPRITADLTAHIVFVFHPNSETQPCDSN